MWVGIFGSLGMLLSSGFLLSEADLRGMGPSGQDGHPKYIGAGTRDLFSLSRVAVKDCPPVEQSAGNPFKVIES